MIITYLEYLPADDWSDKTVIVTGCGIPYSI